MTSWRRRRILARQEAETRAWANQAGRALVGALCGGEPLPATPYRVGVVLGPAEHPWIECPARFSGEPSPGTQDAGKQAPRPPMRAWLVTSERVVGRLGDDRLWGYRFEHMVGCRVDLTEGSEQVSLDLDGQVPLSWTGPGIAPLAVAAVYHLHGVAALVDHPGLAPLRVRHHLARTVSEPVAELPPARTGPAEWWR